MARFDLSKLNLV